MYWHIYTEPSTAWLRRWIFVSLPFSQNMHFLDLKLYMSMFWRIN